MNLLIAYYGDDFTGSADVMEVLQWAGLRTVLFIDPPTPTQLASFPDLQAFGVAGTSRAMSPEEMEQELIPTLRQLRASGAKLLHYKICSTFDSSPEIGNIGKVLEISQKVVGRQPVPIIVGAPQLGRYQVFGNLFARSGLDTEPVRLDRQPTMVRHPITPMRESDLRVHLAHQTALPVELFDALQLDDEGYQEGFRQQIEQGAAAILVDVLYDRQLARIGILLESLLGRHAQQFVIGSSGVEYALTAAWKKSGFSRETQPESKVDLMQATPTFSATDQLLVLTGSCSPVNARQVAAAGQQGFAAVALDTAALVNESTAGQAVDQAIDSGVSHLRQGRSVILHSSLGPEDQRIQESRSAMRDLGLGDLAMKLHSGRLLGPKFGMILDGVLRRHPLQRVAVAGGDTSGHIARHLGIVALEAVAPVAPGSPLCKVHADNRYDGIEMFFKGGQVGRDNVWLTMLQGTQHEH